MSLQASSRLLAESKIPQMVRGRKREGKESQERQILLHEIEDDIVNQALYLSYFHVCRGSLRYVCTTITVIIGVLFDQI